MTETYSALERDDEAMELAGLVDVLRGYLKAGYSTARRGTGVWSEADEDVTRVTWAFSGHPRGDVASLMLYEEGADVAVSAAQFPSGEGWERHVQEHSVNLGTSRLLAGVILNSQGAIATVPPIE